MNALIGRLRRKRSGGRARPVRFGHARLEFASPGQARLRVTIHDIDGSNQTIGKPAGGMTIVLEAVGDNPRQPWAITALEDGELDGRELFAK